jgi:hypothetical protein
MTKITSADLGAIIQEAVKNALTEQTGSPEKQQKRKRLGEMGRNKPSNDCRVKQQPNSNKPI